MIRAATTRAAPPAAALRQALSQAPPSAAALVSLPLVRHGAASPLTVRPSPAEAPRLAAAARFFERHPCRLLYSAATGTPPRQQQQQQQQRGTPVPEVAVLGASNAGKSTFLNALVGRRGIARVSQTPGRTALLNAFAVGPPARPGLVVVDTPGYGFASRADWGAAVTEYLATRRELRAAVVLLSSEKGRLLPADEWLLRTLAEAAKPTLVALTKADKGRGPWAPRCAAMADAVLEALAALDASVGGGWRAAAGPTGDVFITAAGIHCSGKLGNGGGMGAVRAAILDMAGFTVQERVSKKDHDVAYTGPVVSFDDITWK